MYFLYEAHVALTKTHRYIHTVEGIHTCVGSPQLTSLYTYNTNVLYILYIIIYLGNEKTPGPFCGNC
jgi:hypothetical protein